MWIIKVLNGPNAGGQILISGEVMVGTDLSCDLILNDPHVAAHHCRLKKEGDDSQNGYLEIIPEEGVVFLNGKHLDEPSGHLALGDVLTLGSTHLTAGPSEQLWPPVTIPELQEIGGKKADPEKNETPPEEEKKEEKEDIERETSTEEQTKIETHQHDKHPKKPKKPNHILAFIGLGLTLIAFIIGVFLILKVLLNTKKTTRADVAPQALIAEDRTPPEKQEIKVTDEITKEIKKMAPNSYVRVLRQKGDDIVYIYVADEEELAHVRQIMNSENIPVPYNIITIPSIEESAAAMTESLDIAVTATVDPEGSVTWKGYLPNENLLESFQQQIHRDISAIAHNKFEIILGDQAYQKISIFLVKNGFPKITVTPEHRDISLAGIIPSEEADSWHKTLKKLENDLNDSIPLINLVKISSQPFAATPALFGSPIVSISISGTPYATLQNGERLFIGAKAPNGYVIEAITPEGITINNGEVKKTLPLNSNI